MASGSESLAADRKLSDIFTEGYNLYKSLETTTKPFNSEEFQNDVKKCIQLFEDSTRLVSLTGMFSPNENISETPTENLKYMLLPFFLGQLVSKIQRRNRLECLQVAEVYYRDFIKRCEDYELVPRASEVGRVSSGPRDEKEELVEMALKRNSKIEKFRQKKELEEQLKMLKISMDSESVDDETKREFYLKLLQTSIIEAKDELESMKMEMQILEMRKSAGADDRAMLGPAKGNDSHTHHSHHEHNHHHRPEPLKPIIITRNDIQKAVYGLGYPSLPVMTVNEFYDQRVRDGIFPDPEKVKNMKPVTGGKTEEEEEEEKARNEALEEADDEEYLARRRGFDEYKDNVRRGDGNRHNRS